MAHCPVKRDVRGRISHGWNGEAFERFLRYCKFDPGTGCVVWTGGTTAGRGHSARYGAFWFEGRRWFVHRWAAKYIHGLDIDGVQVGHCCHDYVPSLTAPNSLCIEHLEAQTPEINRAAQTEHMRAVRQTIEQRRFWVHAQVGILEPPPVSHPCFTQIPFYEEPEWLRRLAA